MIHAAVESKRNGFDPQPEIMVPLVSGPPVLPFGSLIGEVTSLIVLSHPLFMQVSISKELKSSTDLVHATAKAALQELGRYASIYTCIMHKCPPPPLRAPNDLRPWTHSSNAPFIHTYINTRNSNVEYKVGTMLELPRACLLADTLAVR